MSNATRVLNRTYANLGNVTITFDDHTQVTHNINQIDTGDGPSVGTYFDQDSTRNPLTISVLGSTYGIANLPESISYPDDDLTGTISMRISDLYYEKGYEINLDEAA